MKKTFFSHMDGDMASGPTCLYFMTRYYNKIYDANTFKEKTGLNGKEVSILDISEAAEKIGFRVRCVQLTCHQIITDIRLPCILPWGEDHFITLLPQNKWSFNKKIKYADPVKGFQSWTKNEFKRQWKSKVAKGEENTATVLLLEPSFKFYGKKEAPEKLSWKLVLQYFQRSRWQIVQVVIALLITSLLQLMFPFLTQSIVDVGINTQDLNYITIVLIAQSMLILGLVMADFIRSRLLLYVSTVANLSILSDFWIKLTRLPVAYFDRQHTGEILQRIQDNKQIQNFLTGPALSTFFSAFNFIVFAIVLMMYRVQLFLVFGAGVLLYFLWMLLFLRIRRKINYQIFHVSSKENNVTLQMVQGMQEIRLQNVSQSKRWEWESVQAEIFKLNIKNLSYEQLQRAGAVMINQGKNVFLTFIVAALVMDGKLSFGSMLAVEYIIGQLSGPIEHFIGFVQVAQDAKISMERLNEVHKMQDEEDTSREYIEQLPGNRSIIFNDLSFSYPGGVTEQVLQNIQLEIPEGKTTAIVGVSGSGKTTLLKLLLKFYDKYEGEIKIGDTDFRDISPSFWRKQCGAVLQEGYIFNDTIAGNIAVEYEQPDYTRLIQACKLTNILSFIESLPDGFNTQLGTDGIGISQGQKQRLLIARAVYKNPGYLFFDESTNALDANNEQEIVENLQTFFEGRTVIVVAHRLSTVKNADRIIVLHQGRIIEQGNHQALSRLKGKYFELVRNQLELGS